MRFVSYFVLVLALPALAGAAPSRKLPKRPELVFPADPGCPKNKKEWQAQGPRILAEKALLQNAPIEIPDLAAKLKKKGSGTTGSAIPFHGIGSPMVMVKVKDEASSLFLSGVLKCDTEKHAPALLSLTYVQGAKSGLVKVIEQ